MRKWLLTLLASLAGLALWAQEPYPELGAKLDEYFTALAGESADVQSAECDYLIEECQDSLVRRYVTLKIYDHYLNSKIMGDDAVAVHVADKWLLSGKVRMNSSLDLMNAQIFAEFNRHSLIGQTAPVLSLLSPSGEKVRMPARDGYSVLYFYDTSCSTCKLETPRLKELVASGAFPAHWYAIYTGDDAASWEAFRADFPGVEHLWDPEVDSDWQRQYGVLKTPKLFLVGPTGQILGRGLDTPALKMLLAKEFDSQEYTYGEPSRMARYDQLFGAYGDSLEVADVLDVAAYMAARTFGEGDLNAFKQIFGDLLYYISSKRTPVFREAAIPFVEKYIELPDVWNTDMDRAQVTSLGSMLKELAGRTPVGSQVPDLQVHGTLRQKGCLFRKASREGVFGLRDLKGRPGYVVFYTGGCSTCKETLAAVDALVKANSRARVLLVDMDAVMTDYPDEATMLLDTFDLSALPFVLELDKAGVVQGRYLQL